ncbi:hypothetical protein H6P81_004214 [Aristolochia fimbriata]|uniref:MADS-box domain-containing protein n=1 Tax=Aristolochia fimbriata TaxID=158543 RepID=A0AAV7FHN1_ARIFI|nr:hypothetical protein H6P81_004214 [Aristolochia fimbriata]
MVKRKGMGRRKLEMKKIENPNSLQVCFSKRRAGLFKKASELCLLTGAQIAIIAFSPAGRVFTFGHPSVDAVIDRHPLGAQRDATSEIPQLDPETEEMSRHCSDLMEKVETEKRRKVALEEIKVKPGEGGFWWEADLEGRSLQELEEFKMSLESLRDSVVNGAEEKANLAWLERYLDLN